MSYRIYVDGYCELPEQLLENSHMSVVASGKEPENIKFKKKGIFQNLRGRAEGLPAPSPEQFKNAMDSVSVDMIFVLTVSERLSDSYLNARLAKGMFLEENPGAKVRVINTNTFGYGEGVIAKKLVNLCESGKKFGEISARISRYLSTLFPVYIGSYSD